MKNECDELKIAILIDIVFDDKVTRALQVKAEKKLKEFAKNVLRGNKDDSKKGL